MARITPACDVVRDFRPGYLVRLTDGTMLVLEVKPGHAGAANQAGVSE